MSNGAGTPKINITVSALRFFFKVTLDRPDLTKHLAFMHEPLQNQRVDECISAASDLIGSLERFKKIKGRVRGSATQEAFDQLLASFHNFDCAYRITCRYRPDLDPNASHHVAKILFFLDVDDDGSAPIEQRADGAANSLFLIIDEVSPWPRPKEPSALSRLVGRLGFAVRRHRE
jgi:hypothetical protein